MFFYRFLYVFIWPLFRLLFHPKVRGRENIPKSGAIIFAGNHKSNLDCVLLATCLWRQVHFMAKDELFRGAAGRIFPSPGHNSRQQAHPRCLRLERGSKGA